MEAPSHNMFDQKHGFLAGYTNNQTEKKAYIKVGVSKKGKYLFSY